MRDIDETDRELLRLLLEDGRRPYKELAEAVELSPPAVSDRIDRLRELGVIQRFTVDVDRSKLREGVRLAVTLSVRPGETTAVREALADVEGVEHVFATADSRLFVVATFPSGDIETHLAAAFDTGAVEAVEATPLVGADWHPALGEVTLGLECAECGNTVTDEGVSATIDGDRYEFCCGSCEARFEERYAELQQNA
ncbi:Lrp/AsnC family transcription regulator [Natronomonas pharaonis DSM 2160]|uniref:Lrp/AsnC family transcription regulator n=1 Tax=Natronomonas pharaonis (strain ATCC 35678 / DSM 2160 / CIP 103997 / JCM 8858 / NBRC 14720 / NCIMB 2260 / Gabara) TaxID=348780 RepID=A0A1U7EWG2_NATPD|nr:AsnC family transcriptional regulator [Natronomonas pharaonis]CAI49423.1 Lrp/AsnC family transcription regulator [Natronomonas pharaonis DSM 2160]